MQPANARAEPYVFISHASGDRARVLEVVTALRDAGIPCWLDEHDITGGANWGGSIADAITGCAVLVLLSSAASLASRNVRQELALAWQHEKPCLPLLLDRSPVPNDVAYWLATAQWIEVLYHPVEVWLPKVEHALIGHGVQPLPVLASANGSQAPPPPGLPVPLTPTVGREAEIAAISDNLWSARLLTLLGAGGTGKTRLAQEVARRVHRTFPDGVVWVDLTPITDPALVVPTIANALGVNETADEPPLQTLARAIGARTLLLVLDNMEQAVDAATDVSDLLQRCPNLSVLATSRVALRVTVEREHPVPPLDVPEPDADLERLLRNAAVALFVQRAQAVRPTFTLTRENARAVAAICRRLDGLPLALELSAARVAVLTPQALLQRLNHSLDILRGGARDLPERQRTIRDTIQWSFDLLLPSEQLLLRRLSVFVGGWTLEAAEAVVGVSTNDVLDGLASLRDKSLILQRELPGDELRFGMLETIREFAREQLERDDERARVERAHADYFLQQVVAFDDYRRAVGRYELYELAEREFPNIRAVIRWGLTQDLALAAELVAILTGFWLWRGQLQEGHELATAALTGMSEPNMTRARLLEGIANFGALPGDQQIDLMNEAINIARSIGNVRLLGEMLQESADILIHRREVELARARYEEALPLCRASGDHESELRCLMGLGGVAFVSGDVVEALRRFEETVALARASSDPVVWGAHLCYLSDTLVVQGEQARALALYREVMTQPSRYVDLRFVIRSVEGVARIVAPTDPTRAATLLGATRAARDRIAYTTVSVVVAVTYAPDSLIEGLRQLLGNPDFNAAWERGQRLTLDDAVALALELTAA